LQKGIGRIGPKGGTTSPPADGSLAPALAFGVGFPQMLRTGADHGQGGFA
jgi:hypothetical protein